jgi:hypothetical protein
MRSSLQSYDTHPHTMTEPPLKGTDLCNESITTLPCPARGPDLNLIEHIWDIIGRRVKERTPPVQTLNDLEQTLHQEWQRLTQVQICRSVGIMRRRLAAVIRVNGSYTHY